MLELYRTFKGKGAVDQYPLNKNRFLESVLVEVVTENYRQMVSETLIRAQEARRTGLLRLDPVLRAAESVGASVFQTAISRVASRSRSEVRVERGDDASTRGRVDYLAWYANHAIGLELKVARMALGLAEPSPVDEAESPARIGNRWRNVVGQANSAAVTLGRLKEEDPKLYPRPFCLPLLVVVGQRRLKPDAIDTFEEHLDDYKQAFCERLPKDADYLALYTVPQEFRRTCVRRAGKADRDSESVLYVPFYAFLSKRVDAIPGA